MAKTSCTSWKALGLTYPLKPKHLEERKSSPVTRHGDFHQKGEVFASSGQFLHYRTSLDSSSDSSSFPLQETMVGTASSKEDIGMSLLQV